MVAKKQKGCWQASGDSGEGSQGTLMGWLESAKQAPPQ
jgi:hypothetical protein